MFETSHFRHAIADQSSYPLVFRLSLTFWQALYCKRLCSICRVGPNPFGIWRCWKSWCRGNQRYCPLIDCYSGESSPLGRQGPASTLERSCATLKGLSAFSSYLRGWPRGHRTGSFRADSTVDFFVRVAFLIDQRPKCWNLSLKIVMNRLLGKSIPLLFDA